MELVPIIEPPIMKALTTPAERVIPMRVQSDLAWWGGSRFA